MKAVVMFCVLVPIMGLGQIGPEAEKKFVSNCYGSSMIMLPLLEFTTQEKGGYYTLKYFKNPYAPKPGEEMDFNFRANKYEIEYLRKFLISRFGDFKKKSLKIGDNTLYVRGIFNEGYEQDGFNRPACGDCEIMVSVDDRSSFKMTKSCVNNLFDFRE
jgi:hypothetical protein